MDNYDNDTNRQNYQGMYAWKPNRVEHSIWGTRETHEKPFSPNIDVHRNWYGQVTRVERKWGNW